MYKIYLLLVLFSFTAHASNDENPLIETQKNENTQDTLNNSSSLIQSDTSSTPQLTNSTPIQQIEIPKKWGDVPNKRLFPLIESEFLLEKNLKHFLVYENPGTAKPITNANKENLSNRIQLQYICVLKKGLNIENIKICYQQRKEENKSISEIRTIQPGDTFILTHNHKTAPLKNTIEKDDLTLPELYTPYFTWLGDKTSITYAEYIELVKKDY